MNSETSKGQQNRERLERAFQRSRPSADFHTLLPDPVGTSKALQGRGLSMCGGHSMLHKFTLEHFNVKLQLLVNVGRDSPEAMAIQ